MTPPIGEIVPYNVRTLDPAENCFDTPLYTAAEMCAEKSKRFVNWYVADWVYAQSTVYLICAFVVVFGVVHRGWVWHCSSSSRRSKPVTSKIAVKTLALVRYLAVKQIRPVPGFAPVSLGNALIVGGLGLFFLLMTFVPRPYYWPEQSWAHSPPLATRTGWMALALFPFLMVLASKQNLIGFLTGISHERLQIFHRAFAFFMLLLGLIHTLTFVNFNRSAGTSEHMWNTSSSYWTGVAMLVPQIWLTFMSIAPIRNTSYEFFKVTHRTVAIIFVVFFFLHCQAILTSWDYFWVMLAVYGSSVLFRLYKMLANRRKLRFNHGASLRQAANDLLVIHVGNTGLRWSAGQHFFFRFTGVNFFDAWQSHPFTVCTVPSTESTDIVAVAKIRRGETAHLALLQSWRNGMNNVGIWLDGPYGDPLAMLPNYENVLLLGGGTGLSFIVSAANKLVLEHGRRDIEIVATCRNVAQLEVYTSLLPPPDKPCDTTSYLLTAHVTEETKMDAKIDESDCGHFDEVKQRAHDSGVQIGRPALRDLIRQASDRAGSSRLAVVACGPAGFLADVRQEVASIELDILAGTTALKELYLRSEMFGW